ncbi:MAG: DUF2934 domain-containing protein [Acidobacteriia bacterium]|nr:DUF2934 domain-containing protein [Terriglobia bacterium]
MKVEEEDSSVERMRSDRKLFPDEPVRTDKLTNQSAQESNQRSAEAVWEKTKRRAYQLYEQRGKVDGYALSDWLRAEKEVEKDSPPFTVTGKVTGQDGRPLSGVTIKAFDRKADAQDALLGQTATDDQGNYLVTYVRDLLRGKPSADLVIGLYCEGKLVQKTEVILNAKPTEIKDFVVPSTKFVVRGQIRFANGRDYSGARVKVYGKNLRSENLLGAARPDQQGSYEICYALPNLAGPGTLAGPPPDLVVRVFNASGQQLAESPVHFKANREEEIDLAVSGSPISEWKKINDTVLPLLAGQDVQPHELTEEDLTFVSQHTGLDMEQVRLWALAAKTSKSSTQLGDSQGADSIAPQFFYGWFRQTLPTNLPELLKTPTADLIAALNRAIEAKTVPSVPEGSLSALSLAVNRRRIIDALHPATDRKSTTLGHVLRTVPNPDRLKLNDPNGIGYQLIEALLDSSLDATKRETRIHEVAGNALSRSIKRALGLNSLTLGHVPLMSALQSTDPDDAGARLEDLVAKETGDWLKLAQMHGVPDEIKGESDAERQNLYAKRLAHTVEMMHPSAYVAYRIREDRIPVQEKLKQPILQFFQANPAFRLKEQSVFAWFDSKDVKTDGIATKLIEPTKKELLRVERIANLSVSLENMTPLSTKGFHSAHHVVQLSRDTFVKEMSPHLTGGEAAALDIFNTAQATVANAHALAITYGTRFNSQNLPVMPNMRTRQDNASSALSTPGGASATLSELFGDLDYFECAHGASMYGPAAYFVDLLKMLDSTKTPDGTKTTLDVLLKCRPDLAQIDLTADNAEITLPYIDLVLEVLEHSLKEIGMGVRVDRGSRNPDGTVKPYEYDSALTNGQIPSGLRKNLESSLNIVLEGTFHAQKTADVTKAGAIFPCWTINSDQWRIQLAGVIPIGYRVWDIFPQSSTSQKLPAEIPAAFLADPYAVLATARYPWSLPACLARDECSTWLDYLGVSRHELMEAFQGGPRWSSVDSACEVLNISPGERVILTKTPVDSFADWGFDARDGVTVFDPIAGITRPTNEAPDKSSNWVDLLKNVTLLRARARLTHRELLNLLETRFLQLGPGKQLELSGDECNLATMRVEGITEHLARRLHLFVRLWRKLGWTVFDLDRAIAAHGSAVSKTEAADSFTDEFIIFLANIVRLKRQTRRPVGELLAMFRSKLDTQSYRDHSGARAEQELSSYESLYDNPTLVRPRVPEFSLDASGQDLTHPPATTGLPRLRLSDHLTFLSAVLCIPMEAVKALLPAAKDTILPLAVTGKLTGMDISISPGENPIFEVLLGQTQPKAEYTLQLEHSEDGSDFVPIPATELDPQSQLAAVTAANGWTLARRRYTGTKKHLRVCVTEIKGNPPINPKFWLSARVLVTEGRVADELSLESLLYLSRIATLARSLGLPLDHALILSDISGIDPFSSSQSLLTLIDALEAVRKCGFSTPELNALLRCRGVTDQAAIEEESKCAQVLEAIRSGVQAFREETTVPADQRSELVRKLLVSIGWNTTLVETVLGRDFLGCTRENYQASLDDLPVKLPYGLTYDGAKKMLRAETASGIMRPASVLKDINAVRDQSDYQGLSDDKRVKLDSALVSIEQQAKRRAEQIVKLKSLMSCFELPMFEVEYEWQGAFPKEWAGRFYYDPATRRLRFLGWMSSDEKDSLLQLRLDDPHYAPAVEILFEAGEKYDAEKVDEANRLVYMEEQSPSPVHPRLTAEKLLLDTEGLEERCDVLLQYLLLFVRRQRAKSLTVSNLAAGYSIGAAAGEQLLLGLRHRGKPVLDEVLLEQGFAESALAIPVSPAAFGSQFDVMKRLGRLAILIDRLGLSSGQVNWLFGAWKDIDLSLLPVTPSSGSAAPLWSSFIALAKLVALRHQAPNGLATLEAVRQASSLPPGAALDKALGDALEWPERNLRDLTGNNALHLTIDDYRRPEKVGMLVACVDLARELGANAILLDRWRQPQVTMLDAEAAQQLAYSRQSGGNWEATAREVLNQVRTRRRDALVEYLVYYHKVRDANDLYGYYLIDPEMGASMMTSRIKQGISSVQLFVQRCLMGLEPDAGRVNDDRWPWMKNYRVWEANRKVLLYPENWIEPELRDDKTPIFDSLMSDTLQGDISSDKAETAYSRYLDGVREIARLEPVAMCRETDEKGRTKVHVFGRTGSDPRKYFYRRYTEAGTDMLGASWTPWQPVELDIEGDHLIAFVTEGRLHLCWALFDEVSLEQNPSAENPHSPQKTWDIKLAWSAYRGGKWSARKTSGSMWPAFSKWFIDSSGTNSCDGQDLFFQTVVKDEHLYLLPLVNRSDKPYLFFRYPGADRPYWMNTTLPLVVMRFDHDKLRRVQILDRWEDKLFLVPAEDGELAITTAGVDFTCQDKHIGTVIKRPVPTSRLLETNDGVPVLHVPDRVGTPVRLLVGNQETGLHLFVPQESLSDSESQIRVPFFYADVDRTFFLYPRWTQDFIVHGPSGTGFGDFIFHSKLEVSVFSFDYLHAKRYSERLLRDGLEKLLSPAEQEEPLYPTGLKGSFSGNAGYARDIFTLGRKPNDDVPFATDEPNGLYSWELFFHLPFTIACQLSKNQRFEEARRWFHFIFDPTDASSDRTRACYWRFRPFREAGSGFDVRELIRKLADKTDRSAEKIDLQNQIALWQEDPFKPHVVARMRPRAYMFAVVMKYLDNIIAWGDQLFRRDTMESLNEASQLYILAAQILGRRPEGIPRRTRPVVSCFSDLRKDLADGGLNNPLVQLENLVAATAEHTAVSKAGEGLTSLYFCVPDNDKLWEYYIKVDDRLRKLRNCMNIDGVFRQPPLFEPMIDPALLVRAAAAGVDIAAVLADVNAPRPFYRFSVMTSKASELCAEVKALGSALLAASEKKDAEALSLLRSSLEIQLLERIRLIKALQMQEVKASLDALGVSLESAQQRMTYYVSLVSQLESLDIPVGTAGPTIQSLATAAIETLGVASSFVQAIAAPVNPIGAASLDLLKQAMNRASEAIAASLPPQSVATAKVPMNEAEKHQLEELKAAHDLQEKAMDQRMLAQILSKIPDFTLGTSGIASPVVIAQIGGSLLSAFANFQASVMDSQASEHSYRASLHSILAGYQRRAGEWLHQAQLALKDIEQISKQITAAGLRLSISAEEARNHEVQIQNARETDSFMRSKFTNQELYGWMVGQLAGVYFQSYQLAYDVAKRAERAFQYELGSDASFIKFGYWDSLKKGLLAGENLSGDLKRMEVAYLQQNARELEITKHISLRQLDPSALVTLSALGQCEFEVPEWLFNLDFPSHYFRRIKSVSLSIPCVVGPYMSVSATLTLLSSRIRRSASLAPAANGVYDNSANLTDDYSQVQSIATSSAQNDSGIFELNFRDERYLPFEGVGAISHWRLQLPQEFRLFDYGTISDVILHIRYTARDGGEPLRKMSTDGLKGQLSKLVHDDAPLFQLINVRHEFPSEWHQLIDGSHSSKIAIEKCRFPYLTCGKTVKINGVSCAISTSGSASPTLSLEAPGNVSGGPTPIALSALPGNGKVFVGQNTTMTQEIADDGGTVSGEWTIELGATGLDKLKDLLLILHYTLQDAA